MLRTNRSDGICILLANHIGRRVTGRQSPSNITGSRSECSHPCSCQGPWRNPSPTKNPGLCNQPNPHLICPISCQRLNSEWNCKFRALASLWWPLSIPLPPHTQKRYQQKVLGQTEVAVADVRVKFDFSPDEGHATWLQSVLSIYKIIYRRYQVSRYILTNLLIRQCEAQLQTTFNKQLVVPIAEEVVAGIDSLGYHFRAMYMGELLSRVWHDMSWSGARCFCGATELGEIPTPSVAILQTYLTSCETAAWTTGMICTLGTDTYSSIAFFPGKHFPCYTLSLT